MDEKIEDIVRKIKRDRIINGINSYGRRVVEEMENMLSQELSDAIDKRILEELLKRY